MIFTSINFFIFFCILLFSFAIVQNSKYRQYILLIASYIFYGAWNPSYLILIGFCSLFGWWTGLKIHGTKSNRLKKRYLIGNIIVSLAILGYFKYANFFAENVTNLFGLDYSGLDIILPVGISFFTFQAMSYTIDLYRGTIPVCSNLMRFMLFVAFFPQLVAGPIVRAKDFLPQLDKPILLKKNNFIIGIQIFLGGVLQKVLIADNLSLYIDPVFNNPSLYSQSTLLLALCSYSIQIFCDFCGYSLMAIGIARIFGFTLIENFRMPYISLSITEFWRRWHISLSFWLRDYLYISLGGNRKGEIHTRLNLLITMVLGGLWHGASWNFVFWGTLHGLALIVHKVWLSVNNPFKDTISYRLLAWLATYFFVVLCWLPFRSPDVKTTMLYLRSMFSFEHTGIQWLQPQSIIILSIVICWHLAYKYDFKIITSYPKPTINRFPTMITVSFSIILILLYAPLNTSPFIYFQF